MKTKTLFTGIAFSAVLSLPVFGQATWTSQSAGGEWATPGLWTGTAPVNSGTSALTFDTATANRTYTNSLTNLTVSSLTIASGSKDNNVTGNGINLAGGITVSTGNWQTFNIDMALGNAARTIAVNAGRLYLGGVLSGTGGAITKSGGGDLWLTNANSFTGIGTNTVNSTITGAGTYSQALLFSGGGSGTVVLQNTAALGAATNSVRFTGSGSGVLDLQTDTSVNAYSIFSGSNHGGTINAGRATAGAGITHNLGVLDLSSVTMTVNTGSNVTSGTAGVSFTSLSMSGGNDNNPVKIAGSAAIGIGPAAITNNTSTTRRLQLDGTNASNTIGVISNLAAGANTSGGGNNGLGIVNLIKSNSSTWTLTGANTYSGYTVIAGGTLQLGNGGASGTLNPASSIQNGGVLAFNRSGTITQGTDFAATIGAYTTDYTTNSSGVALGSPVLGKLSKSGTGNLVLNGSNTLNATDSLTFSGSNSGTVTLKNTAALGSAGNMVRFSGNGSGVLDLQTDTSVNAYGIASGTFNGATITVNRATTGAGITHALGVLDLSSVTLTANTGGNVTSGTAGISFTELKMSGGNDNNPVTLAGSATYSVASASITNNGISKRLQLDGTSSGNTIGAISNTNNSIAGSIVNLIKANTSTWTLTSANTYTGDTTIKGGTLVLGASASIANTPKIIVGDKASSGAVLDVSAKTGGFTIGSAQTLSGIGTVDANDGSNKYTVTLASGAKHAVGNSDENAGIGKQTVDGNLTYSAGSIFEWDLNGNTTASRGTAGGFDAVDGTGTLSVSNATGTGAVFKIILGTGVNLADSFWSTPAVTRTWTNIFSGFTLASGTGFDTSNIQVTGQSVSGIGSFTISGTSLTWTAVPETSSAMAGLLIAAGMLRRRRA